MLSGLIEAFLGLVGIFGILKRCSWTSEWGVCSSCVVLGSGLVCEQDKGLIWVLGLGFGLYWDVGKLGNKGIKTL